jgi:conjugal transfer mating pair stabilization protein TraN
VTSASTIRSPVRARSTKVYKCPVDAADRSRQYICGDDVYCIDGDANRSSAGVDRVQGRRPLGCTLGQANTEFDPIR